MKAIPNQWAAWSAGDSLMKISGIQYVKVLSLREHRNAILRARQALAPTVESRAGRQHRFSTHRTANRTSPLQREGFLLNPVPVWN